MKVRILTFTLLILLVASSQVISAMTAGQNVSMKLIDVDGRTLSARDGQVTLLILAPRKDLDKAHIVRDRTPDYCLGNPKYRMITVIEFSKTTNPAVRYLFTTLVRQRLVTEAKELKQRYLARHVVGDPRQDIHVVADFDGATVSQLGLPESTDAFKVFVLAPGGMVLRQWNGVPSSQELDDALR